MRLTRISGCFVGQYFKLKTNVKTNIFLFNFTAFCIQKQGFTNENKKKQVYSGNKTFDQRFGANLKNIY